MVTSKQMVEKFRDYKRSLIYNWRLFKESRIGLIGVGILIFFSLMAVSAPFLGLKHPVDWMAPSVDILDVEPFFGDAGVAVDGPINKSLGFRVAPKALDAKADRIYVAFNNKITAIKPNGLTRWTYDCGASNSNIRTDLITTQPVVVNIGHKVDTNRQEQRIIFGTIEGTLGVMRDNSGEESTTKPQSANTYLTTALDGAVMRAPACLDLDGTSGDMLFVTTEAGTLYAFTFASDTADIFPVWSVHVVDSPLNAPIISKKMNAIVFSDRTGKLYSHSISDGSTVWAAPYDAVSSISSDLGIATSQDDETIYMTTDNGRLHAVNSLDGTPFSADWNGGMLLMKDSINADEGPLYTPAPSKDGKEVYITSSSGFFYSVRTSTLSLKWKYDATEGGRIPGATFDSPPYFDLRYMKGIFAISRNPNSTLGDTTDDFSTLYSFSSEENKTFNWKMQIQGIAMGEPILWHDSDDSHLNPSVWIGMSVGGTSGVAYSYSCTGTYLAPLKPTWMTNPASEEAKDRPPKSGNYYLFGTDTQGRDLLSQTIWGSQIALMVGFASAFFSILIGMVIGLVSGYYGGKVDIVMMRFTDVILVLPGLPLLIILAALLSPSIWNIVLIISIVGWGGIARVIRAEVLSLKERPFIDSARVSGASKARIMFRHIAPNVLPLAMLYMTFGVAGGILSEASLSFIGLGDPRTMSWGMMLNMVQHENALTNWWWLMPPGLCITLVCMAFFMLGRAFDEIVNPRLRRRR